MRLSVSQQGACQPTKYISGDEESELGIQPAVSSQSRARDQPVVEDVTIPVHLLQGAARKASLYPTSRGTLTDVERKFSVYKLPDTLAQEVRAFDQRQRAVSIIAGPADQDPSAGFGTPVSTFPVIPSRTYDRKTSVQIGPRGSIAPTNWTSGLDIAEEDEDGKMDSEDELPPMSHKKNHIRRQSTVKRVNSQKRRQSTQILYRDLQDYSLPGASNGGGFAPLEKSITWLAPDNAGADTEDITPLKMRRGTLARIPDAIDAAVDNVTQKIRRSSMWDMYEAAKVRKIELQRKKWVQILFEYSIYLLLIAIVYFVLIGLPLWNGTVYYMWWVISKKFVLRGSFSIVIGIAFLYAYAPLCVFYEKDLPTPDRPPGYDLKNDPGVRDTALLIPCYKSAGLIANTLEAALKVFPPTHIFVIANGNSPTPLDNTEEVCQPYGVNHIWSPVGSKIVAQFVGCYAAKGFKNVLLIDDDCALPPNFPVIADRLKGNIKCIGYTIKSVGPNSTRGTLCQQAQDIEYKLSGLQRAMSGKIGSVTFPHGAIAIWDRDFLISTFHDHPGFSVSEDWFFGHVARKLGSRITMCSHIFVETETPGAVIFSSGGARGGFGEMTVFKQRFKRWNFFFVNGMYYNMAYILGSWKLGWWEIGAKIFVFQEVYETLLYLLAPFVLPISFLVRPSFTGLLLGSTAVMYYIQVIIFNEVHLRRKNERCGFVAVYIYYLPYKMLLTFINVASCYWSLYKYAQYFAKRHPKIIEDENAVEVVLRLEESNSAEKKRVSQGRRMTVTAIGARMSVVEELMEKQEIKEQSRLWSIAESTPSHETGSRKPSRVRSLRQSRKLSYAFPGAELADTADTRSARNIKRDSAIGPSDFEKEYSVETMRSHNPTMEDAESRAARRHRSLPRSRSQSPTAMSQSDADTSSLLDRATTPEILTAPLNSVASHSTLSEVRNVGVGISRGDSRKGSKKRSAALPAVAEERRSSIRPAAVLTEEDAAQGATESFMSEHRLGRGDSVRSIGLNRESSLRHHWPSRHPSRAGRTQSQLQETGSMIPPLQGPPGATGPTPFRARSGRRPLVRELSNSNRQHTSDASLQSSPAHQQAAAAFDAQGANGVSRQASMVSRPASQMSYSSDVDVSLPRPASTISVSNMGVVTEEIPMNLMFPHRSPSAARRELPSEHRLGRVLPENSHPPADAVSSEQDPVSDDGAEQKPQSM